VNGYDKLTQDDFYAAESEAISVRLSWMEKDPAQVYQAMGEYDPEEYDLLDRLEVQAHISDEWSAYIEARKRIQAKWMRELAKRTEGFMQATRCAQTADLFANRLSRDEE
jgi:hypothetical protein